MVRILTLGLIVSGVCGLISRLAAGVEKKPSQPLKVTATLLETKLEPEKWFKATFRVENVTSETQTFRVMCCSYADQWQCDNTKLTIGSQQCAKNTPMDVTLEPGKSYSDVLDIQVAADAPHGKMTFRLGFTPIESKTTYWSEPLDLNVGMGE